MKTIEKTFNAETGEETLVERELTKAEIDKAKLNEDNANKRTEHFLKQEEDRKALLQRLGLSEAEAALLLS
jgi:hypothetical protein